MTQFYQRFLDEVASAAPKVAYGWSVEKEASCRWMIDRIQPTTRGVDIGGTEYICREVTKKGCEITFYDAHASTEHAPAVRDDMANVLAHFEPNSLDFITTRHTLEHSLSPLFQLWCYNQILKDDGHLFVIVPNHRPEWVWFETHYNCLPYENWVMLFHRAGFKIKTADAGSWKPYDHKFIEWRFDLEMDHRGLRL